MFVIDAFIGNTDRHNGNWGIIDDCKTSKVYFSPIYDCGSSLNPLLSDEDINNLDDSELKNLAVNTYSCIKLDNSKINYVNFMESISNKELNDAILRVFPNIDLNSINSFIDNIDCISDVRKEFYKNILNVRYEIIRKVYDKLNN